MPRAPEKRRSIDPELSRPIRVRESLREGASVTLDAHAMAALALREVNVKEAFTLVDAEGTFFRASLKEGTSVTGKALVYERMSRSTESPANITLVCAVLGRQRMITVVQKATEFGCMAIAPVWSDHSVKPSEIDYEKPWAWPGQAIKAAKQCRRASVPVVHDIVSLRDVLGQKGWSDARARFVLDDGSLGTKDQSALELTDTPASYILLVGPEGGWSDRERALLRDANATSLKLGARVLRAETAVFAGLSILQHRLGDLR